jgi:molybdopterin/thiamine biosynthesis adenylyltransferase
MKNYVMVGVGGTGTHLLRPLLAYLKSFHGDGEDWMLHLIDGDVVETKNLERQMFEPGTVTMNKADAAMLANANAFGDHISPHPFYLSEENMERLITSGDVVFICADNFTVRARIEERALQLGYCTIINGGNEKYDGSVQLFIRADNVNLTPTISYLHPEVKVGEGEDRAEMTCQQAAALPGGEQTLLANLWSATLMLTAFHRYMIGITILAGDEPSESTWTEAQFDSRTGEVTRIDQRMSKYWNVAS